MMLKLLSILNITKGNGGTIIYLKNKVVVQDTRGAGTIFISGFLSELISLDISINNLHQKVSPNHQRLLTFSNASGPLTASVKFYV
ncbi:hypothetical protein [Priestia endophytica]|jgi:fructokinase|uniref:hypothetical protein n=1 Tax=Priestia endophytica TaxID=135735 RepID=UPI000F5301CB|nr:hypothetical protein [Priestia endophytica]MED4072878.1 hypothetical protein [Priestia endophytica]